MRVPAAKSSGFWVQPCSITTSGRFAVPTPGGSKSLNERVPAAQVKLLSSNRDGRERPTTGGASTTSTHDGSVTGASSIVATSRETADAVRRDGDEARADLLAPGSSARWIAAVASTSLPLRTRRPADRIFFRN